MQFNSIRYILFLAGVTLLYYFLPLAARKILLLCASFAFYMQWNVKCSLLMAAVIGITYIFALLMVKKSQYKKIFLLCGLLGTLAFLFYFKYLNFLLEMLNMLFGTGFQALNIILPVGISFYVFQSVGYLIDVYRDDTACEKSLLNYALFISFFPQLVAGPIERSTNMLRQFKQKQAFQLENIKNGITLILIGLVEKVTIADRLAIFVQGVFNHYENAGRGTLALAVVFFAFQVYCDFNAYSIIAIGSARLMGYQLMQNFHNPYLARSFGDYWKRWHISLSTWFEDYLFAPFVYAEPLKKLGQKFAGLVPKLGLVLVFFVSGLWHGADLTFVVWGLLHALFRVIETSTAKQQRRFLKKHGIARTAPLLCLGQTLLTFGLNCVTYVFFCADTLTQATGYLRCFVFGSATVAPITDFGMLEGELILSVLLIVGLLLLQIQNEKYHPNQRIEDVIEEKPVLLQGTIFAVLLLLLVACGTYGANYVENPFVYFQF